MCVCGEDTEEELNENIKNEKINNLPIVYSHHYRVKFCGLQNLHPFDAAKGFHILEHLLRSKLIKMEYLTIPEEISNGDLIRVHSKKYLDSLKVIYNTYLIIYCSYVYIFKYQFYLILIRT